MDSNIEKDMMVFISCNICGSREYREICDIKIFPHLTPSKLVRCKTCGFFYANPRLKREDEEDYHRKIHYHHERKDDYWYAGRIGTFRKSFRRMRKFLKKSKLIDVGCGMGYFMDLARGNGWEVKGVDISSYAVNYARVKLGLDVFNATLKEAGFETGYFDAATLWNTLDQLYDPKANLIELNRILKKRGYLFIRVPNLYFHLKLYRLMNRLRPLFRNIKRTPTAFHVYSFDKNSIKRLLELTGFSNVIVKTEPLAANARRLVEIFGKREKIVRKLVDSAAGIVYFLTLGKIVISPSIFVIAQK